VIGGNQQVFQAFLSRGAVAELANLVADDFGDGGVGQRSDGSAGVLQQRVAVSMRQVGNVLQVGR